MVFPAEMILNRRRSRHINYQLSTINYQLQYAKYCV